MLYGKPKHTEKDFRGEPMKDRIVFFTIGAVVVMLSFFIANMVNESKPVEDKNPTFETVKIMGTLTIGNKDSYIILQSKENESNLLIDSKGSSVLITTRPDESSIMLSKEIGEFINIGALLQSEQRPYGKSESSLVIKDTNGQNVIRSTEKN